MALRSGLQQSFMLGRKFTEQESEINRRGSEVIGTTGEVEGVTGRFVDATKLSSANLLGQSGAAETAIKRGMELGGIARQGARATDVQRLNQDSVNPFAAPSLAPVPFFIPTGPAATKAAATEEADDGLTAPGDPTNMSAAAARQDAAAAARDGMSKPVVAGRREALMARRGQSIGLSPLGRGFTARNLLSTTPL